MGAVLKLSGGTGSWLAGRVWVDQHGADDLVCLFTDTLMEDQDAYRFLIAGAANLFGARLPSGFIPEISEFPAWEDREAYKAFVLGLRACCASVLPGLVWLSDGRDPWDVYEDERFLGNSRVDPCSKVLKRQMAVRHLTANFDPETTTLIVGIDHEEAHRFLGVPGKKAGIQAAWAKAGWRSEAPLVDTMIPRLGRLARLATEMLWLPRLNAYGFSHNNCGGACSKGGIGHWLLMYDVFPERFAYSLWREEQIRLRIGDVSMLTDRRGGEKKPLPLSLLRQRRATPEERADMGACNCFFGDDFHLAGAAA